MGLCSVDGVLIIGWSSKYRDAKTVHLHVNFILLDLSPSFVVISKDTGLEQAPHVEITALSFLVVRYDSKINWM